MQWDEILLISVKTTSHEEKEIIEFGIGLFDLKEVRLKESVSFFVKPTKKLTQYCSNVTGVAASDLSDAANFFDLYEFVQKNFNSQKIPWASYGNLAEVVLKSQCKQKNLEFLLSDRFLNLRHFFAFFCGDQEVSIDELLFKFGISVGSKTCEDDIYNCAILLKLILSKRELIINNV